MLSAGPEQSAGQSDSQESIVRRFIRLEFRQLSNVVSQKLEQDSLDFRIAFVSLFGQDRHLTSSSRSLRFTLCQLLLRERSRRSLFF
jgi:hypothetical protein